MTTPELITKFSHYVHGQINEINPHEPMTREHALYELGILRAVVARILLEDNKNNQIINDLIETLKRQGNVSK